MKITDFRKLIDEQGKIAACIAVGRTDVTNEAQADAFIRYKVHDALENGYYDVAGMLLWGMAVFDTRPRSVKRVIKAILGASKLLVQGAGAMGKSYTACAWLLMDWIRDPQWTSIQVISTTTGHAKKNVFSTFKHLHRTAIIPLDGVVLDDFIGIDPSERRHGISQISIPAGESGKGRLQGMHPVPRPAPHPKFGRSSRVRIYLDECEEIPFGVWDGVSNLSTTIDGLETIKIIGTYNPKDVSSKVAALAEPVLSTAKPEDLYEWKSREGWNVIRLDGAQCENVIQREVIYPGLMTYEGYMELVNKGNGNSSEYYTFGRGLYPPQGVISSIISAGLWTSSIGSFLFVGKPINVAGDDIAVDGRDAHIMTVGRFGLAKGFLPKYGTPIMFPEPRKCLQVDQQFELSKGDTLTVAVALRKKSTELEVAPEWLNLDRTGNGGTPHDFLRASWSADVQGTDFSKSATEVKILAEDLDSPKEKYDGVVTEVWFACAKWMEFHYLCISPVLENDKIRQEVLGRRYKQAEGRKTRVEKKDDYKARLGHSPDYADSFTLILHGVRMRSSEMGSSTGRPDEQLPDREQEIARHDTSHDSQFYDIR